MHQERARVPGRAGEEVRGKGVHGERGGGLGLGRIHPVPGGGVPDDIGPRARQEGAHRPLVGDVDLGPVARPGDLRAERGDELAAELSGRAEDDGPHAPIASASAKSRAVSPPASCVLSTSVTFE